MYYGDELGMENGAVSYTNKSSDPWGKNTATMDYGRDPERTPMQWNSEKNAGFSASEPWLPIAKKYESINVQKESLNSKSMLALYKKLIHYRLSSETLKNGSYRSLELKHDKIFAYLRETAVEKILVIINFSDQDQKISISEFNQGTIICNSRLDKKFGDVVPLTDFKLRPDEGYIIEISNP